MTTEVIITDQKGADLVTLQNNDQIRKAVKSLSDELDGFTPPPPPSGDVDLADINFQAWTAYTPAMTATVGNPTFTVTGRWQQIGGLIVCTVKATYNGAVGSGDYRLELPAAAETTHSVIGSGTFFDASTGDYYGLHARLVTATTFQMLTVIASGATNVFNPAGATFPVAPAASDRFEITLQYEAVS